MAASVRNIRTALARSAAPGQEPRWRDLLGEFVSVTSSSLAPEAERLLLDILRFEGELQLDESSEMPHRMSPEEMLKSLAVQALGRWTGSDFLPTMRRLEATVSPALSCMVRGVIQQVTARGERPGRVEAVEEIHYREPEYVVTLDSDRASADDAVTRVLGDKEFQVRLPIVQVSGMTLLANDRRSSLNRRPAGGSI